MRVPIETEEILIRIPETGSDFIYTIRQGKDVVRSAMVRLADTEDPDDTYYGGSQVSD